MLLLHEAIPQKNIGSSRCSSQQELLVSALAQTDALTKLLIEKGLITQAEFMQKLSAERAGYQAMVRKMR
ncbi:MAG: hypothetical protein IH856_19975 [Deltaproteobacteria bacterium]|nr:hypothetical protein [Deltaproteobacteria bacterium]